MFKSLFKTQEPQIDDLTAAMYDIVVRAEKFAVSKLEQADDAQAAIAALQVQRSEAEFEAKEAQKIADKLAKILGLGE